MTSDYDSEIRLLARTLADIAHALDSSDHAEARIRRVLSLTRQMVPFETCALLKAVPSVPPQLFVLPELAPSERAKLMSTLTSVLELVRNAEDIGHSSDGPRGLTLPLMGLDEVIGVIRAVPSDELSYDARHLRLLSVVAAQLGAYLTMIRLREDEARRADELAAANDFQQRLMGIVSHDLNNPLSVVTMVATSLLRETSDPRKERAIRHVLRNAERASRIISDLLDATRIRVTGELTLAPQETDLVELLEDAVEDLRLAHPGREIELAMAAHDRLVGKWDPDRLAQVVTNLVNNAVRYGDEQSPVRVELGVSGDEVELSVANNGPAIPADLLPTIFDPFKRGAGQKRVAGGGLGLGLYIVAQIARAHGGDIGASSSASRGTVFTVRLPTTPLGLEGAAAPASAAGQASTQGSDGLAGAARTVMVVDDDEDVRAGLSGLLESEGYKVVTASNGVEALEILHGGLRPHLILLDLGMPVMDGETFSSVCRGERDLAQIPIVIISADTASAVKLARSERLRFLEKPVAPDRLLQTLQEVVA